MFEAFNRGKVQQTRSKVSRGEAAVPAEVWSGRGWGRLWCSLWCWWNSLDSDFWHGCCHRPSHGEVGADAVSGQGSLLWEVWPRCWYWVWCRWHCLEGDCRDWRAMRLPGWALSAKVGRGEAAVPAEVWSGGGRGRLWCSLWCWWNSLDSDFWHGCCHRPSRGEVGADAVSGQGSLLWEVWPRCWYWVWRRWHCLEGDCRHWRAMWLPGWALSAKVGRGEAAVPAEVWSGRGWGRLWCSLWCWWNSLDSDFWHGCCHRPSRGEVGADAVSGQGSLLWEVWPRCWYWVWCRWHCLEGDWRHWRATRLPGWALRAKVGRGEAAVPAEVWSGGGRGRHECSLRCWWNSLDSDFWHGCCHRPSRGEVGADAVSGQGSLLWEVWPRCWYWVCLEGDWRMQMALLGRWLKALACHAIAGLSA